MTLTDLLQAQLTEPFRIGLIVGLLYTAIRNQAVTRLLVPLVAGLVFVAVILPSTMGLGAAADLGFWYVAGVGLLSNAIILAVVFAGWQIARRFFP